MKVEPKIYRPDGEFMTLDGHTLTRLVPIDGGQVLYRAIGVCQETVGGVVGRREFPVDIEAQTPQEAFEKAPESMQAKAAEVRAEIRSQLLLARPGPPSPTGGNGGGFKTNRRF